MQDTESNLAAEFFDNVSELLNTIKEQASTISKLKADNNILREKYDAILSERIEELKKRNEELLHQLNTGKE